MSEFNIGFVALVIILIWLFYSLNILREYERGVILPVGPVAAGSQGSGVDLGLLAD